MTDKPEAKVSRNPKAKSPEALTGVEEFIVVHPKVNLFVGDDEDTYVVGDAVVPVVNGWVTVPLGTRIKATTAEELADFRLKVQLGFLSGVAAT